MSRLLPLCLQLALLVALSIGAAVIGSDHGHGTIIFATLCSALTLCAVTAAQIAVALRRKTVRRAVVLQPIRSAPAMRQTRRFMERNGALLTMDAAPGKTARMRRSIEADRAHVQTDRDRPVPTGWPTAPRKDRTGTRWNTVA